MNVFGMGAWEMMIILVAALVIFGPGKLPEVAGQAGRAVRDFRRMTSELSGEFEKTIADVTDTKGTLGNDLKGMANQVNSVTNSVKKDLNKATGATGSKSTAKSTTAKSTSSTSTKPKSTTTTSASRTTTAASSAAKSTGSSAKAAAAPPAPKVPTKADPLADLFFTEDDTLPASSSARPVPASAPKPRASTTTVAAPAAGQAVDAVARARQRRLSAGYNSHRTP
jgi:sec-independent protein translocase protein TatB